jgi:hypothetical protein
MATKKQIVFPLATELVARDVLRETEETILLEAGEPIGFESMEYASGVHTIYLGEFVCVFNIPSNFAIIE